MSIDCDVETRLRALNDRWLRLARSGDLERAWEVSDEALALRQGLDCSRWPRHQQFVWRGQNLRGKRVLVRCYHGLGDSIQFVRFLPRLRAIASTVVLWVQPPLIPLVRTLANGADELLPLHDGMPEAEYDVDIELFELMHVLRISLGAVTTVSPYILPAEPEAAGASESAPLRVGLVWMAGAWNEQRSIPCELLAPLQQIGGVEWVLFQRGPGLARWHHSFGRTPAMAGMLDEAREMRRLHLLISVDTCSAHLAGALGVPVWTLLPHRADWRWMRDRSDTPWYPSMRLIRQQVAGDWGGVVSEVEAKLREVQRSRREARLGSAGCARERSF